jgi:hypothetical protein
MVFPALCVFGEALKNAVITNESEQAEKRFEWNKNKFFGIKIGLLIVKA